MSGEQLGLILRGLAAVVWTVLFVIRVGQRPARRANDLRLKVLDLTVAVIAWAFVFGALVNLGVFTRDVGTLVYTATATGLFVVGVALVTLRDEL